MIADAADAGRLRRRRRHRPGRARPRRAGLAHHLGRSRRRRRRRRGGRARGRGRRAAADIEATLRRGRLRRAGRRARAGDGGRQRHRPRAPRAARATDPEALVPLVRHAGAVFCGPLAPASVGDYLAGPSHVLPTYGSARFAGALTRRRLPEARPRRHRRPSRLRRGRRRTSIALADAEGLAAHAESIRLAAQEAVVIAPPRRPRAHGGLPLAPGRRRRPAQHQRGARAAAARRSPTRWPPSWPTLDWHRYPDRAATELRERHRRAPRRRPGAGVRGQRLERGAADAAAHLRRAGPLGGRRSSPPTRCTATSPGSPAPAWSTGERADDFALDLDEVAARRSPRRSRRSPSCARPTTPPGMVEAEATVREVLGLVAAACSWSTRPTASSRRGRRSSWSTTTCRWSSPAPTPRRGRWRRPGSAT